VVFVRDEKQCVLLQQQVDALSVDHHGNTPLVRHLSLTAMSFSVSVRVRVNG